MNIEIKTFQGLPCTFKMDNRSTLKDLKTKIKDFFGLSFSEQTLLFKNQTLNDENKKLNEYGIENKCCVKLIVNFIRDVFKFTVSMQTGQTFEIEVRSKDSLSEVKKKIEQHCKLHPEEQILIYFGNILSGNEPISSYGVQDKSSIQLLHKITSRQIFKFTISLETRQTFEIEARHMDSLSEVKKKIEQHCKLRPEEQILVYLGKVLEGNEPLLSYGIQEESIVLVKRKIINSDSSVQKSAAVPSRSSKQETQEPIKINVKIWRNGFNINDGPLRSLTDPSGREFLSSLSKWQVPVEILEAHKYAHIDLSMEYRGHEDFKKPPSPKTTSFHGTGQKLGYAREPTKVIEPKTIPPVNIVVVDENQPVTRIQIRLEDNSRLVLRINHHHTVGDIRRHIVAQCPKYRTRSFTLMKTFPYIVLANDSISIAAANLLNAVVVQRLS